MQTSNSDYSRRAECLDNGKDNKQEGIETKRRCAFESNVLDLISVSRRT